MAKKKVFKPRNPFIYEGYEGADYFCDREKETEIFISNLQNGRNITLVSPRKIGKTGLIHHVFDRIKQNDNAICIYVDIFHTQNQYDFVQTLGRAIVEEKLLDTRNSISKVLNYFSQWRPTISPDPVTGIPKVSVAIERTKTEYTLKDIFDYLKQSNREVYLAIDEFQTITEYPERGTEALLRSYIQFIHNVHFVFSGSKQHLMYEMFGSPKRPFYQSTALMTLEPLDPDVYYDFAKSWFESKKGSLKQDVFEQFYYLFDGYTWYLQSILNRLYETERHVTNYQQVRDAIMRIIKDKTGQYEMIMTFLTDNQQRLLKAIARDGCVAQLQANDFIRKYELPSASSIKKALTALMDKDLIYQSAKGYIVYDRFFDLWLKHTFM